MEVVEIIHQVHGLPFLQQMQIAESIIHSMRQNDPMPLEVAAERLYEDYMTDNNLTAFTQLDCEDFLR